MIEHGDSLYISGYFRAVDNVQANNVALWNGTQWKALGNGLDNSVRALALDSSGNLYAAGYFTHSGTDSMNQLAKWDGSKWNAIIASNSKGHLYLFVCD